MRFEIFGHEPWKIKEVAAVFSFQRTVPVYLLLQMLVKMLSSSAIAKANGNTTASPTVETLEFNLIPHDLQNPPSLPHASTSFSYGVPTIVTQRMPCSSSSIQTVSVLMEGMEDILIRAAVLIVEATITACSQIDSPKFIRCVTS